MLFITSLPVSSKTVVHLYHSRPLKKALFYYSTSTSFFYYCTHAPSQKSRELCHLSKSKISVILFSSCLFNPRFDIHLNCYLYLKREIRQIRIVMTGQSIMQKYFQFQLFLSIMGYRLGSQFMFFSFILVFYHPPHYCYYYYNQP